MKEHFNKMDGGGMGQEDNFNQEGSFIWTKQFLYEFLKTILRYSYKFHLTEFGNS